MLHELKARRKEIETLVQSSEKALVEARNSAALGGHSRAVLLHLERKVHAGKKDLARLDSQLAIGAASMDARE
ncbi:hypothetical protein [Methylocella tundrae]|uniref:Uncharacterized protein n=1 Tax=Methylocella tundrae TaxID=227605 RepID=A0A4U8Z4B2_METTU|nr:hypothetical protein [Methylocella tundrae]WPP04061.1 hypothetical protein SIN04_16625 [Methylocella tundrae]VFU10298.1 conserved protein of unknown function [Methylocella tundrae]